MKSCCAALKHKGQPERDLAGDAGAAAERHVLTVSAWVDGKPRLFDPAPRRAWVYNM